MIMGRWRWWWWGWWWWRWWWGWCRHRPRLEAAGCGKNLTQGNQTPQDEDYNEDLIITNMMMNDDDLSQQQVTVWCTIDHRQRIMIIGAFTGKINCLDRSMEFSLLSQMLIIMIRKMMTMIILVLERSLSEGRNRAWWGFEPLVRPVAPSRTATWSHSATQRTITQCNTYHTNKNQSTKFNHCCCCVTDPADSLYSGMPTERSTNNQKRLHKILP